MDSKVVKIGAARPGAETYYERFIAREGVPVVTGFGVMDLRNIQLKPWKRLGCEGAYLHLRGLEGITGVYIVKLAAGASTTPERHLYEKIFYVLSGEGVAEIQQRDRVPQNIHWRSGSVFSPPMNTLHRLINHAEQPALLLAVTTAPMALDHYHNEHFVFNSDFSFNDRYDGEPDYFDAGIERYMATNNRQWLWETNFIPDARHAQIDAEEQKRASVNVMQFEISNNTLIGHLAVWPVGRYHKAHFHGGGAVLVILRSSGYSLMWPNHLGARPYESGFSSDVVRVDWAPGSVFSPPTNWFHQHFNTGSEPALQLVLRCGSEKFPLGIRVAAIRAGVYPSGKQGGSLIDYADEDPSIRRTYETELAQRGIALQMNCDSSANDERRLA